MFSCCLLFPALHSLRHFFCLFLGQVNAAAEPPPIEHFLERDSFGRIEISPDGRHLAASAPMDKGGALVVLDRDSLEMTGHFYAGERFEVTNFAWASDQRLVMNVGEKVSGLEAPDRHRRAVRNGFQRRSDSSCSPA